MFKKIVNLNKHFLNDSNVFGFKYISNNSEVRVRFAPSPTGYLHLGGLRTALYNYLFAKSQKGKFILRIEDTDQTRKVEGAIEQLLKDLKWLGIEIDEGPTICGTYGSYLQSERLNIYKKNVNHLLENGSAYHCFCTDRRLDLLKREALRLRQVPKYDNRCRHLLREEVEKKLKNDQRSCIRFKLTPDCETFEDMVYGNIAYDVALNEGDPVIMKSDGFPTYHFANVVDDHLMKISHVLRGVEWQLSTTKHILMYRAFKWEPPVFAHLPLLLNSDGSKLSKRQGDIKVMSFKQSGIFPQALVNFVVNAGGGFNKETGLKPKSYTMDELIEMFNMERINSHSTKLMPEMLPEFNRLELIRQLDDEEKRNKLISKVKKIVQETFPDEYNNNNLCLEDQHVKNILTWSTARINKLTDLVSDNFAFLWIIPSVFDNEQHSDVLFKLKQAITEVDDFNKESLKTFFKEFSEQNGIAFSELMKLLRMVLSGLQKGPGVVEMIEILGKESTIKRIENYTSHFNQ